MSAAGRRLGREGRHRHQFRAPHLAPAPFLPPPGEARPDWWIVTQVARRMGFAMRFAYRSAADVFREHAALSAFENDGARDFDLGAPAISTRALTRSILFNGRRRAKGSGTASFLRERRLLHAGRPARFIATRAAGTERAAERCFPVPAQHGPRARPVAHHDAHRAPQTDPYSGQPESKGTPAAVAPHDFKFRGFLLAREAPSFAADDWFTRVALSGGAGALFATDVGLPTWAERARAWFRPDADFAEYTDPSGGHYRAAAFVDGRLAGCVFVGPAADAPRWDALKALFEADGIAPADRRMLLSGRTSEGIDDSGPLVCACFGVGLHAIRRAVAGGAAVSVENIGSALKAGTNCGSCVPELRRIIAHERAAQAV
jgi:bacterioferritin-associated ferredoxin